MSQFNIHSIRLNQFRQYDGDHIIEGLQPGLNVIAGSNEAGKSTLLMAVRAAMFEKYRSSTGPTFRPYDAVVSPQVALGFSLDDVTYEISKVFSTKKDGEVRLVASNGKVWEGPAAEDELASLLEFSYPGRGASKPEHQGLAGLLWVDQGTAYEGIELRDEPRRRIQSVFADEMRELLGGEKGDELFQKIVAARSLFLGANDQPIGDYKKLIDKEQQLAETLSSIEAELDAYREKAVLLERQDKELRELVQSGAVAAAESALQGAQQRQAELEALRQKAELAKPAVENAKLQAKNAASALHRRRTEIAQAADSAEEVQRLSESVERQEAEIQPYSDDLKRLREEIIEKRARERKLAADLRVARSLEQIAQLDQQIERLKADIEVASTAWTCKADADRLLAEIRIDKHAFSELQQLESDINIDQARLDAVATQFDFEVLADKDVSLGGESLKGSGSVALTEPVELSVPDIGRFVITPGGEGVDSLLADLDELRLELGQKLTGVGVDSIEQAQQQLATRKRLTLEIEQYAQDYDRAAPDGIDAVRDALSRLESDRGQQQSVADCADVTLEPISELEAAIDVVADEVDAIDVSIGSLSNIYEGLKTALTEDKGNLRSALDQKKRSDLQLRQEREVSTDDELREASNAANSEVTELEAALADAEQEIKDMNPAAIESDVERFVEAEEQIASRLAELKQSTRDIRTMLDALGQRGLSEQVGEAAQKHAAVQVQLAAMHKKARALNLLHRTLSEGLNRAKQAVAQPVVDKLVPYVRQLIPGSEPIVDEDLGLVGITRGGNDEAFKDLSIGTREQLAVLLRLAYADLLCEAGVPVSIVLDDALVNSDDDRRDSMKSILYQASKRYQVIVLTCHGRDYADAGGNFIRLEEVA